MRLLAYSHDTVGLGHLRRTLGICDELVRHLPQLTVLVITGSPVAEGFHLPPRVDYVKLPSVRKLDDSSYAARTLDVDIERLAHLRRMVILDTCRAFDPDVLLVDKSPAGIHGELLPMLRELRDGRTHVVLGLRDVLDEPAALHREWEREGLWRTVEEFYDAVWIYGDRDFFDTVDEYRFPAAIAAKSHYLGLLPRYNGLLPRETVHRELGLGERRLVVVTAGGGEDGYYVFDHYLSGLERGLGADGTLHCLVTGPAMPADQREALRARANRADVHFVAFSDHMTSLFAASDLVVTMGGYNSTMEVLSLGCRAIVVPRTFPRTEQLIRAERLASRGLVGYVHPEHLSPETLHAAVGDELRGPVRSRATLRFDGHEGVRREFERVATEAGRALAARRRAGA